VIDEAIRLKPISGFAQLPFDGRNTGLSKMLAEKVEKDNFFITFYFIIVYFTKLTFLICEHPLVSVYKFKKYFRTQNLTPARLA
jgi:hypothetical protein